jgi:hypothetical protein
MIRSTRAFALIAVLFSPLSAFALPGDAAAVLSHCGAPTSDYQTTSPVTGKAERNITYGDTILHFEPSEGGWSFMSAWKGHLPQSRDKVMARMPCFSDALEESAAKPVAVADPTIAQDKDVAPIGIQFGTLFLWLIFAMIAVIIIFALMPYSRRRQVKTLPIQPRRRPNVTGAPFRPRRPTDPTD